MEIERWRDGEMEMERWRDGEMERWRGWTAKEEKRNSPLLFPLPATPKHHHNVLIFLSLAADNSSLLLSTPH
jgi:hypothetical protein